MKKIVRTREEELAATRPSIHKNKKKYGKKERRKNRKPLQDCSDV